MNTSAREPSPSADAATPKSAASKPAHSALYRDERRGEFSVELSVSGTVYMTIDAADLADARRKVEAMIEKDEIELYGEDVEEAKVRYLQASVPMYLVLRDGKEMGVSYVLPGDEPTAPTSAYMTMKYLPPDDGAGNGTASTTDADRDPGTSQ